MTYLLSYLRRLSFAVCTALLFVLCEGCDGLTDDMDFCRQRIEGRYGLVDNRDVRKGPDLGYDVFAGNLYVEVSDDGTAFMSGGWGCKGRMVGLNLKMESFTVEKEDGTSLYYEMGIVESSRSLYRLQWDYTVRGTVMNKYGEIVDYYAKGHVDARRFNSSH